MTPETPQQPIQENTVQTTPATPAVEAAPVVAAPVVATTPTEEVPAKKVKKERKTKKAAVKAEASEKAVKAPKEHKAKKEPKEEEKEETKAKATKAATKEQPAPHTGQSGPEIEKSYDELNANERKVLDCFDPKVEREPKSLNDLAGKAFSNKKLAQGNSWVRNAMRKLVCANWTEKTGRGMYRLTVKGRNRLQKLDKTE